MASSSLPLHVAFLTDAPRIAGSEVWLLTMLPLLQQDGLEATVFLSHAAPLDELAQRFEEQGIGVVRYRDRLSLPTLTLPYDLRVVQAWDPAMYRDVLPQLAQPRTVIIHDQLDYHYPLGLKSFYRRIYQRTKADLFKNAAQIITVSDWGSRFLKEEFGVGQVVGLKNGVDTKKFAPASPTEREALRQKFGFSRPVVLVPGRFALEKNQMAAVLAARQVPEADFVFVGDMDSAFGPLARAAAQGQPHIQFWGRRRDMPDLYRAADLLLQPTLAENQSLVTLEAMASGLPVITTGIPAQRELIEDGLTGRIAPATPHALAQAVKGALRSGSERARWSAAARAFVTERHHLDRARRRLAEVLRAGAAEHKT